MIQRNSIPELFGYLNDAADLLEDTSHYEVILGIMQKVDEQATELVWKPHFNSFYKANYMGKWLIVRTLHDFTYDNVEYVIFGNKDCKGKAKNLREAESIMMRYLDAI